MKPAGRVVVFLLALALTVVITPLPTWRVFLAYILVGSIATMCYIAGTSSRHAEDVRTQPPSRLG